MKKSISDVGQKQENVAPLTHTDAPRNQPEIVRVGNVKDCTLGGGKMWEDGNKFQERA